MSVGVAKYKNSSPINHFNIDLSNVETDSRKQNFEWEESYSYLSFLVHFIQQLLTDFHITSYTKYNDIHLFYKKH